MALIAFKITGVMLVIGHDSKFHLKQFLYEPS